MAYQDQGTGATVRLSLVALVLILAAAALIMFARPSAGDVPVAAQPPGDTANSGADRRASPDEIRAYLNDMFDRLDRDGSGYVEPAEAPRRQVMSTRLGDGTIRQWPLTQAEWLEQGDGDGDGRVSRTEYFSRLVPPVQSIFGVPADWQPGEREPPDRADQQQ